MNNQRSFLTVENFLYLVLFALALVLRLYQLNAHPLTDAEAREALTAYRLVHGQAETGATLPHSPAYFFFTCFGFLLFGASEAIARLAPALFGAGLVCLPALFRDSLGRAPALLTSGFLAISAGLMAASRSADGAMIALCGLGIGLGLLRRYFATGSPMWLVMGAVALGIGLAGGAAFLTGALMLGLTLLVVTWLNPEEMGALRETWAKVRAQGTTFFLTLGITAIVVATLGLVYHRGLAALAESWLVWLGGFAPSASGRSPLTLLLFLLVYEPVLVVFGGVGLVRAFRSSRRFSQRLSWFCLSALAFTLLYSGRTLFDVIWIVAPLAALAGSTLVEVVGGAWDRGREEWPLVAVQVGVILALLGFAALNLAAFAEQVRVNPDISQGQFLFSGRAIPVSRLAYVYLSGMAILLALVVSYLFSMGWSSRAAWLGLTLGASAALLAAGLSAGWGLTQARSNSPIELWWERPTLDDLNRLMETLGTVSNYSAGNEHDVQVTVQASPEGALGWALRAFPHAGFVDKLDPLVTSPVVIAPAEEANPTLGSAYVGQGFDLRASWSASLTWPEQIGWLVFRRASIQPERVILWVRQDVAKLPDAGKAK